MSNLYWTYTLSFIELRVFEIPSFVICILLILFLGILYKIPYKYQFILTVHCFLPFLLNDVLFSASYMPDQFRYLNEVNEIRSGTIGIIEALISNKDTLQASAFFALMPFPTPISAISLGFHNTFLYIVLFFVLYVKKIFTRFSIWFYLLFPSTALYTALSLRETLIFFFMILTVIYARESKIFKSILFLIPIYLIKFQNFFILGPIILIYYVLKVASKGMGITKAFIIIFISMASLVLSAPMAIPLVNKSRVSMYAEDGGDRDDVHLISGPLEFISEGLTSGFYFLSKPFFWEVSGLLPFIQSIENLFLLLIIFLITRQAFHKQPDKLAFWLLFLALSMSVYGLVVFNYGTAVRYRYPFVMIYVLFICADCNIIRLFPKKKIILDRS